MGELGRAMSVGVTNWGERQTRMAVADLLATMMDSTVDITMTKTTYFRDCLTLSTTWLDRAHLDVDSTCASLLPACTCTKVGLCDAKQYSARD